MTERRIIGGASSGAPPQVAREVNLEPERNGQVEPNSLLANLRRAAARQQEEQLKEFMVGGEFKKTLWIRYKPLDPEPMDTFISRRAKIRELQEEDPRVGLPITQFNMDLMAQGCVAVVGADEDGENKIDLEDEFGKVKLEHRLAMLLELPVPPTGQLNSHEVIMMIFGGNAMRIVEHGDDVLGWMRDPTAQPSPGE